MGNIQDPTGPPCDACKASTGGVAEGSQENIERLWAEFAQVVGGAMCESHYIWWLKHLTEASCIPYHARAEGGQRFLKGAAAPSLTRKPPFKRKGI